MYADLGLRCFIQMRVKASAPPADHVDHDGNRRDHAGNLEKFPCQWWHSGMVIGVDGHVILREIARPAGGFVLAEVAGEDDLHFVEGQCAAEGLAVEFSGPAAAEYGCALKGQVGLVGLEASVGN